MCWMREEKEEEEIVVIYQSLKGDELSRLTRCHSLRHAHSYKPNNPEG